MALAGGIGPVLERARALADEPGICAWPATWSSTPSSPSPTSAEVHALRAEVYAARAEEQESSMARNILRHAAISSEEGRIDLAGHI